MTPTLTTTEEKVMPICGSRLLGGGCFGGGICQALPFLLTEGRTALAVSLVFSTMLFVI